MTTVAHAVRAPRSAPADVRVPPIRVALLGLGQVGCAVADLARQAGEDAPLLLVSALVRNVARPRASATGSIELTADPARALASRPDVVVEVLGGLEPARTLVVAALSSGIPVVTANKSLLAVHGDELFATAARTGTPLRYEASVIAGVPFLGMFARRSRARTATALSGIVNGTSNFILSRMAAERMPFSEALAGAQRAGYAEPDPSKDIQGADAVEKLSVLVRHFANRSVKPEAIETRGIAGVEGPDLARAAAFGGTIRPLVLADWEDGSLKAYAGPAFVPADHCLARVDGVQNAIAVRTRWSGDLFFSGPGAGPIATAATVLDDVAEACLPGATPPPAAAQASACGPIESGWFVRLTAPDLQDAQEGPERLAGLGIRLRRTSSLGSGAAGRQQWLLTAACARDHLEAALDLLSARTGGDTWAIRAIE
jgi:homoserine dehydrogenase